MEILGICGSLRKGSYNRLLLNNVAVLAGDEGAGLRIFDIAKIPFYNADNDGEEKPEAVLEFKDAIEKADGLLMATPEYNYSLPGVLKNAIDWASRPAYKSVLAHKPAAIVSASISPLGGARAQIHLRDVLAGTLTPVYRCPDYLLPAAQSQFDENGILGDSERRGLLQRFVREYLEWISGLKAK